MANGRKTRYTADINEMREEALRPCPVLGYDRDALGIHLFSRKAYTLAESQFRRAIWLNPDEPMFKIHLARCLRRQGRDDEAEQLLKQIKDKKETPCNE